MIMETAVPFDNYTDNYLLQSELQDQIDNALEKLPKEIAEAFKMNRYKGLKYHEIAKIMSVSQRTIEVYIGKALATLRKYLKDYFLIIALPLLICL
jgi:RNA polymerase sigma-70 factor (ECF subfamily)